MKLVVIIPALNEEATLGEVIRGIPDAIGGIQDVEVIVVDDGSSDRTPELARANGAAVVRHSENLGVGEATRSGLDAALAAHADVIVGIDADGQFNPADIPNLLQPVLAGDAEFVTCTRFAVDGYTPEMPWLKRLGNRGMCWIVNRITGKRFSDVACGFRCYSRRTAQRLMLFGRFTSTQETLIALAARRVPMTEVPLRVRGSREHGTSRVANGLVRYALRSIWIIFGALRDHHAMSFFGSFSALFLSVGLALGFFVLAHWYRTGGTSPYRSVLLGCAAALIVAVVLFVLALLADMIGRVRRINEEILFEVRQIRDEVGPRRSG